MCQVQFEASDECGCANKEPVIYEHGTYCDKCGGRIPDYAAG